MKDLKKDERFSGITPFEKRVLLSSATMHGEEMKWVDQAIESNWVTTVGENIDVIERQIAKKLGVKYAVALSNGTAALHLATKLAGEKLYGQAKPNKGTLEGKKVFCSDMTFDATINPIAYEDGEAVFIDTERDTWNMSPEALEKAFEIYPGVKLIVLAHLYGTPGKMDAIRAIADKHGAYIVEDAAESFGAKYYINGEWLETGNLGDYNCISFNGNKIITGSSGGMFLTNSKDDANRIKKWSTQSREPAPWYQHTEIGYNYRISNLVAGVVRGQMPYLDQHIAEKKAIYERYKDGLADLPIQMNPFIAEKSKPNFWLSCMTINPDAMAFHERSDLDEVWETTEGKSSPGEILKALEDFNAEGRPIWKPMHMQPLYVDHAFIKAGEEDVGADIFRRGLCLPSDNKMTVEEQDKVIEIIHRCFR